MDSLQDLRRALVTRSGRRLPAPLRERVAAYARRRRRNGATIRELGIDLGFSYETIRRWTSTSAAERLAPVAVEIVEDATARTVSVSSPAGFRVDGLSLDEAATLLRALG